MRPFSNFILLFATIGLSAASVHAQSTSDRVDNDSSIARIISCYNDDSMDVVNQNAASIWARPPLGRVLGRTQFEVIPADCGESPTVNLDRDGIVRIDGKIIYQNALDPVLEARRAPTDVVALVTEQGSLWTYRAGELKNWYLAQSYSSGIVAFVMARNGALLASTREGKLVVHGQEDVEFRKVKSLKASVGGRIIALLDNGALRDSNGYLYQSIVDPVVDYKIAADGTVIWKTEQGRVGSTKTAVIYDFAGDPVISFKVSQSGRVAYVTASGRLMRDHQDLSNNGILSVLDYRIHADGSVTATGTDGRELYFKP